jgi:hypothetical protein
MAENGTLYRRGSWRAIVLTHVNAFESELASLAQRETVDPKTSDQVTTLLTNARDAAGGRWHLESWWTGARIERAWRSVHAAEVLLSSCQPIAVIRSRYPALIANARHLLRPGDPRRKAIETLASADGSKDDQAAKPTAKGSDEGTERARYVTALQWIREESDESHSRVRSFRNVLIAVTVAMTAVAAGLVVWGFLSPDAVPVCVRPAVAGELVADRTNPAPICPMGGTEPSSGDVPLVAFVGLVGAALASAFAIRKMRGTQTPYSVPLALAVLKLPTGALTALAGVVLIQGEFVPGLSRLDNPAQVLAYAIVLGFAQEAFTRMVDRQGQEVLSAAPGPDPVRAMAAHERKDAQTRSPNTADLEWA